MTDTKTRRRARAGMPIALLAMVSVVILGTLLGTMIVRQHQAASSSTLTLSGGATTPPPGATFTITPHPLQNVPAPSASIPPPAHPFYLQQNALNAAAPPCVIPPLPAAVLGPAGGPTDSGAGAPAATPGSSATATPVSTTTPSLAVPSPTPTTPSGVTTPAPTATVDVNKGANGTPAPTATLPLCGSGHPYAPNCYTTLPGPAPTYDEVRQALVTAATDYGIALSLVEAEAWQESGWQQNVVACDGGVGTMQLMPQTTAWLNQMYGTNFNPYVLQDNAHLGVLMLRYLYAYYLPFCNQGLPANESCTGDTIWPGATDNATLRDIMISAYNEGVGTMANYGIINWWYVQSVLTIRAQFLASQ